MAAPKLRFHDEQGREYPEWETKKIGDYFKVKDIKTIESKETPLMAFVANKGIAPKGKRYDRSALVKTANKQYKRTDYGDFIYSSNNLDVGSIGLNLYGTAAISPVYEIFESKMKMNLQCINTLIQRPKNLYNVLRFRQGVIYGQLRIHPDDFLKVTCSFPSLPEQEKISNFLTMVDHQIDIQSKRVEAMKNRKKGLLQKIFSREIRFRDDEGKEFPEWEKKKLGEVTLIERGASPRPIEKYITSNDEGINWIKIGDAPIDGNVISNVKEKITDEGASKSRAVKKGDLILSNSMSYGRPYLLNVDGCIHDGWLLIRNNQNKFDSAFLLQFLSSPFVKMQYERLSNQGVVSNLNKELVKSVDVYIPSLPEQQKIADFLTAVDKQIEVEEKRLETMKIIKKGLLQQMFI